MPIAQVPLADYFPEAVYLCDSDGRVTAFNAAAETLWGRTPVVGNEYWCGSKAMYTLEGVALPHDQCPMAIAIRERREVGRIEAMLERPSGERRYVLAHPRLIRDEQGKITGAINVVIDITERRRLEDQLREVDRRKDAFISTVAHEMRSPLTPIMSAAHLISTVDNPDALKRIAVVIERQAKVLGRLVNDLFDASRISRGELPIHKTHGPFGQVLELALDMVRPLIELRGQSLTVSPAPTGLLVECDVVRVAQLLGNILTNATKYTPNEGFIDVDISLAGNTVVINVLDSGIGINPNRLMEIFALYSQVDRQDTSGKGGMGVGLSLARDLAHAHGGTIKAYSDGANKGSQFEIKLPIVAHNR